MSFKSLLLGSAAALVAVSGARAADAIIAEPEPVEYVRVCDAYGAGFFYIPGTETCLSVSGYVYFQLGGETYDNVVDTPSYHYGAAANDGYNIATRARINFDARSDTEWGTLRAFVRLEGTWGTSFVDGALALDQAYIELGGLRMGYTESAWVESMNSGVASYGSHSDGGLYYAYQQRHQVNYTFSSSGFTGTLSLEHDDDGAIGTAGVSAAADWIPDLVGVAIYSGDWGGIWAKGAYDSDRSPAAGRQDGWAAQLGAHFSIPNMNGSSLRVLGFYADTVNSYSAGSNWSVLASYNHVFTSTFAASLGFQYMHDVDIDGNGLYDGGANAYAAEISMIWTPITNFELRTEVVYQKTETLDGTLSGFMRFTRYF